MKRKKRWTLLACAVLITAMGLSGCSLGNRESIDNQRVSVEGIRKIEASFGSSGGDGGITLGTGDQEAFIRMINDFTLTEGEKPGSGISEAAYCFDVEDREGRVHTLQFCDQSLTVDKKDHYQISETDSKVLNAYWEDYGLADMLSEEQIPEEGEVEEELLQE